MPVSKHKYFTTLQRASLFSVLAIQFFRKSIKGLQFVSRFKPWVTLDLWPLSSNLHLFFSKTIELYETKYHVNDFVSTEMKTYLMGLIT